jgi:hypothetical protein
MIYNICILLVFYDNFYYYFFFEKNRIFEAYILVFICFSHRVMKYVSLALLLVSLLLLILLLIITTIYIYLSFCDPTCRAKIFSYCYCCVIL